MKNIIVVSAIGWTSRATVHGLTTTIIAYSQAAPSKIFLAIRYSRSRLKGCRMELSSQPAVKSGCWPATTRLRAACSKPSTGARLKLPGSLKAKSDFPVLTNAGKSELGTT